MALKLKIVSDNAAAAGARQSISSESRFSSRRPIRPT